MNEESTKLQALQVKQQLGVQALWHRQHVEPVDPVALPVRRSQHVYDCPAAPSLEGAA